MSQKKTEFLGYRLKETDLLQLEYLFANKKQELEQSASFFLAGIGCGSLLWHRQCNELIYN